MAAEDKWRPYIGLILNSPSRTNPSRMSVSILLLLPLLQTLGSIEIDCTRSVPASSEIANLGQNSTSDVSMSLAHERIRRRLKASSLPEFAAPIGNVTAVLGRDVRLVCTVEHLGQYQVAWLKEETKTILSIDTNIIITNYRIFLIPDEEERKWVLHIKDVQESDRGFYLCQVNTNPTRSTKGYLEVVVPPSIIEAQSSQVAEIEEQANVSLQCRASGHPRPSVSWRRDDGRPIRLNGRFNGPNLAVNGFGEETTMATTTTGLVVDDLITQGQIMTTQALSDIKSDKLNFYHVDRSMAGLYVCTAANGIPSQAIKRIPLFVKFAPKTLVPNKYVSVSLGEQLEIECQVESFPKANSYWSKSVALSNGVRGTQNHQEHQHGNGVWSPNRHALSYRRKQLDSLSNSSSLVDTEMASRETKRLVPPHHHHHYFHSTLQRLAKRLADGEDYLRREGAPIRPLHGYIDNTASYQPISSHQRAPSGANSSSEVSVKHTALNSYTYKIKLSIAKTSEDDYGQYNCIANNPLGQSEAQVIVTRADRISRLSSQMNSATSAVAVDSSADYQRDSLEPTRPQLTRHSGTSSSSGNIGGPRVVYDENYLQTIRQNNQAQASSLGKLQKFKTMRQSSDRSSKAARTNQPANPLVFFMLPIILLILTAFK